MTKKADSENTCSLLCSTQDTFSFGLLLLCLALGDINYLASLRFTGSLRYHLGGRPPVPAELDFDHPELVRLIISMWQPDFRLRPSMKAVVDTLSNLPTSAADDETALTTSMRSVCGNVLSEEEVEEAQQRHQSSSKSFALFLSHHKEACATEARLVKQNYETLLGVACFLGKTHIPHSIAPPLQL